MLSRRRLRPLGRAGLTLGCLLGRIVIQQQHMSYVYTHMQCAHPVSIYIYVYIALFDAYVYIYIYIFFGGAV